MVTQLHVPGNFCAWYAQSMMVKVVLMTFQHRKSNLVRQLLWTKKKDKATDKVEKSIREGYITILFSLQYFPAESQTPLLLEMKVYLLFWLCCFSMGPEEFGGKWQILEISLTLVWIM